MQSSLPTSAHPLPASFGDDPLNRRRSEDLVYQAVTVAAILLVLGSLWVF
jgi:hypothetical protein